MNCGNPTKGKHEFQGVIICSSCKGLVNLCVESCDKQLAQLRVVYLESLRVALASGRLRTTTKVRQGTRKKPTLDEFKMFLSKLVELRDADSESGDGDQRGGQSDDADGFSRDRGRKK